jgi:hypothetical protein
MAWREAEALMTGEAFHVGVAHLFATRDVAQSEALAEACYRKRLVGQMILPEEQALIEQQIELSKRAVRKYADHYKNEPFEVLMPEVKFRVALPNTEHHCWFVHRILDELTNEPGNSRDHLSGFDSDPARCRYKECMQPHWLMGRTDAVISWNNLIWLLEHKTSVNTGQIFYDRFRLDKQTTGYLYGIWKQTGMRPHGFLLNVIKKPNAQAAKTNPFNVTFEREPFIRDEATLDEFEHEISLIANDYETAFRTGNIYKNESSCTNYNRKCYYLNRCENHQQSDDDEFRKRNPDYVDLEYYDLLGIDKPQTQTEIGGDMSVIA